MPYDTVVAKIKAAETLKFGHFAFLGIGALVTVFADVFAPSVRLVALASHRVLNCFCGTSETNPVVAICRLGGKNTFGSFLAV